MANSHRKLCRVVAVLAFTFSPLRPAAKPLYVIQGTDGVATVAATYGSISDAVDTMTRAGLLQFFRARSPSFDPDFSPISLNIEARGVPVKVEVAAGSATITLTVPSVGMRRVFAGRTRDESARAVLDWFKREALTGELGRAFAALSPVDPLAGNPNSAQARTVATSFDRGFTRMAAVADAGARADAAAEATGNANTVSIGGSHSLGFGAHRTASYTLPLGYSWRFDRDVRHQISFDLPITYQTFEGGQVYSLAAGIGYSRPITRYWVLTAGADYAAAASIHLGSAGHVATGTLTSMITLPLKRWFLVHVGNMAGYSQTLRLSVRDYASDPGIKEVVTKNGLMFYFATPRLARSTGFELFALDTRFFGTELYDSGYTEVGTSFGKSKVSVKRGNRYENVLRIGVTALFARGNDGVMVNAGYLF